MIWFRDVEGSWTDGSYPFNRPGQAHVVTGGGGLLYFLLGRRHPKIPECVLLWRGLVRLSAASTINR